jgi:uncharacterized repeat protein (TIGR03837 family)
VGVVRRCDIYCRVVDNFGDIGVLWRLARQLGEEFGWRVRLVVDDLAAFRQIEPAIDDSKPSQWCGKTEIFSWKRPPIGDFSDIVIEGFGCELPEGVVDGIAAQHPKPKWLNLEYLSAEAWVAEHHLLPSHHPQLGIAKTFFFPGFAAGTGGLLRERFVQSPLPSVLPRRALKVFLFAYDLPASEKLATTLAASERVSSVTVPRGALADRLAAAEQSKLRVAAFVSQTEFDALLARFDLLVVRGEDSFVRAVWAGKPFIWQIYPQDHHAHWPKLNAFLKHYCNGLTAAAEYSLRNLWQLVNDMPFEQGRQPRDLGEIWRAYFDYLPEIAAHACRWATAQMKQPDLASNLVALVEKGAKKP